MQLCFDATRFGFSLKEALQLAAVKQVPAVEFSFAPFSVSAKTIGKLSSGEKASLSQLRELSEQEKIEIACINLDYCWQPQDKASGRQFQGMINKLLLVAEALNCRRLSFWLAPSDALWKASVPEVLPPLLEAGTASGVKMLLRLSTPRIYQGQSLSKWRPLAPLEWADMLAEYPNLCLSFSAADCIWQSLDYLRILPGFMAAIEHVEACDVEINRQLLADSGLFGPLWWRYRLPGKGQVDWRQLLEALKLYDYKGNISLQLEDEFAQQSELEQSLQSGLDLLSPYMSGL